MPLLFTLLAALGLALGLTVMIWGFRASPESGAFTRQPETLVWILAIGIQTGFWALVAGPLWKEWWGLRRDVAGVWQTAALVGATLLFLAMLFTPVFARFVTRPVDIPLDQAKAKMVILLVGAALVGAPGVMGLWLLNVRFANHPQPAFEDTIQLKVGAADSLKIGTAVLAPIITGLLSVLVGISK